MPDRACLQCGESFPKDSTSDVCPTCESSVRQTVGPTDDSTSIEPTIAPGVSVGKRGDDYPKNAKAVAPSGDGQVVSSIDAERNVNEETILVGGSTTDDAGAGGGTAKTQPRHFGDYEILDEIARGGMGVVFKARQVSLNRPVALKMILSAQLASEDDVQRFYIEAESAAKLEHPGIVPIHEVGEHEGQHFFSMGLVEGGSLTDLIQDGPLPPRKAAELVRAVADAVQYAHARNIVHRDLKPANVLLDEHCQPKVTDFGLAKNVEQDSGLTATGQVMGTPAYMPPEQAAGRMNEVGPLADVYSLGAILFYLLTGRPPFEGSSLVETLQLVVGREAVSPRQFNDQVDLDLATVCLKCLQKDPAQRYRSAAELADELGSYLKGEPITARPISRPERLWRWGRRNPVIAGVGAFAVIALVAGTIVSTYFAVQSGKNADHFQEQYQRAEGLVGELNTALGEQTKATETAYAAKTKEAETKEELRRGLYVSDMNLTRLLYDDGAMDQLRDRLRDHVPTDEETDLRGFEWYYWQQAASLDVASFESATQPPVLLAVSPDGKTVASAHTANKIVIYDTATRTEVQTIPTASRSRPVALVFSDESTLLAALPKAVIRFRFDDEKNWSRIEDLNDHPGGKIVDLTVAARAPYMASADDQGNVVVRHSKTGTIVELSKKGLKHLALSPDAETLVSLRGTKQFARVSSWSFNPKTNTWTEGPDFGLPSSACLAFHPDGSLLAVGAENRVLIFNADFQLLHDFETAEKVASVAFSPDGSLLAAGLEKINAIWIWNIDMRTHWGKRRQWALRDPALEFKIRGHTQGIVSVGCSDGKSLWSAGDWTVKVWDLAQCEPFGKFSEEIGVNSKLAYSSDGRTLAVYRKDRRIGRWDVATREPLPDWNGGKTVSEVAFSDDGHFLAVRSKETGTLEVWDLTNDTLVHKLAVHGTLTVDEGFEPLAVSGDGRTVAWTQLDAEPPAIALVRGLGGRSNQIDHIDYSWLARVRNVAISPDGQRMAGGIPAASWIWDLKPPTPLQTSKVLRSGGPAASLAFSRDGDTLAIGDWSNEIRIYDVKTGEERLHLKGHASMVSCLAFSPTEPRLASGGFDDTVRIWNTKTGELLSTLTGNRWVVSVAFAPDGKSVASCGLDGTVLIWDAAPSYAKETIESAVDPRDTASAYEVLGDWPQAAENWSQAIDMNPQDVDLQ